MPATPQPLTDEEYAHVFTINDGSSNLHAEMLKMTKPVIEAFNGEAVNLMSIGAGTGNLENDLINECGLRVNQFLALEPNKDLITELNTTVSGWGADLDVIVDERYFDQDYQREDQLKFDLILMVHVIYYIDNPAKAIANAKSFLTPKGKLVIFVMVDKVGGLSTSEKLATIGGNRNPHFVTCAHISSELTSCGLEHEVVEFPRAMDHTAFLERDVTDVVSFLIQTNYTDLDEELKKEIRERVEEKVVEVGGRQVMIGNCGMIIVSK